ncbi:hypothetical protein DS565_21720 [Salmonella enterica subsp. enterica serovar Bareilly]|nr:hypothetical protein [Salmonella enterica subsp. enterica serovar Bareilly]
MNFFIVNTSSDFLGEAQCRFFIQFAFSGYDKNMCTVLSRVRVFSVLIKIISDVRVNFQTTLFLFIVTIKYIFLFFMPLKQVYQMIIFGDTR